MVSILGRRIDHTTFIECLSVIRHHSLALCLADGPFSNQLFGVALTRRRQGMDDPVHRRLGDRGLIRLVVAQAAVAEDIDDDIFVKMHAITVRQLDREYHGFRVVAIDVQYRCLHHFRDLGAVRRRAGIERVTCRKPDLVIHNQMDRPAGGETAGVGHVKSFHDHSLSRECRIAVNQNRQNLIFFIIAAPVLAGTYRAFHHGINDLQMRRVE